MIQIVRKHETIQDETNKKNQSQGDKIYRYMG